MPRTSMRRSVLRLFITFAALAAIVGALAFGIYALGTRCFSKADMPPPAEGRLDSMRMDLSEGYDVVMKNAQDVHAGELILVNNDIAYTFPQIAAPVSVHAYKNRSYKVKDVEVALMEAVMQPLNEMMAAFASITGKRDVNIISAYRDFAYQAQLFEQRVKTEGEEAARQYVAIPGGSEHHTGYALDLGILHDTGLSETFRAQGEYGWLARNAYRYGFVVRYQADKTDITGIAEEPWHLRFVGRVHAFAMAKKGYCLEEYIDFLRQFECGKTHLIVSQEDGTCAEVYFVAQDGEYTAVSVPDDREYTVSGNNVDGFVVTAEWEGTAEFTP